MIDSTGAARTSIQFRPANGYPTREWNTNETWLDKIIVNVPSATAPGQSKVLLRLLDDQGVAVSPGAVELAQFEVIPR